MMIGVRCSCIWFLLTFTDTLGTTEGEPLIRGSNNDYLQDILFKGDLLERWKRSNGLDNEDASDSCQSDVCKKISSNMLLLMDHEADPCEEFHRFACGGKRKESLSNFKQEQYKIIEQYLKTQEYSANYFRLFDDFKESCLSYETDFDIVEKIKFVKDYAGTNLTGVFIDLILSQSLPLFDIGVGIGFKSNYEFQITIPGKSSLNVNTQGWLLFDYIKEACLRQQKFKMDETENYDLNQMYLAFKSCEKKLLVKKVYDFFNVSKLAALELPSDMNMEDLLKFLSTLQNIMPSETEVRHEQISNSYTTISVDELNKKYDLLDWNTLFTGVSRDIVIHGNQSIQLYFPKYFDQVFRFIKTYNEGRLVKILRQFYSLQLYQNLIASRSENRYTYCMDLVCQLMPDVTTILFHETHHIHYWNVLARNLFQDIKNEFNFAIEASKIDDKLKQILQEKLKNIKLGMISSGNTNFTENNYDGIEINKYSFQDNVLILLKQFRKTVYSLVHARVSPASLLNYFISPFYDQPVTFYQTNNIVFHPGIYYKTPMNLPNSLTLAKLGLQFGRELAKHFDLTGRNFMINGDIESTHSTYNFLETQMNELVISVYMKSPYQLRNNEITFELTDGNLLVNELIADNAAYRMVWDNFKKAQDKIKMPWVNDTFSPEKIFFIIAAQEYCEQTTEEDFMLDLLESRRVPSEIKIHNIISNSADFIETFECPEGSAMLLVDSNLITQFPYIEVEEEYDEFEY